MLAKLYPAKVLGEKGARKTHYLKEALEFYVPDLEFLVKHLSKEGSLDVLTDKDSEAWSEENGVPAYANDTTAWVMKSLVSTAKGKASSAYKVNGDTPETLAVEVTGKLPQSMEDLVASERSGAYFSQRSEFLKVFGAWAKAHTRAPDLFIAALGRPSLDSTDREAWPIIEKAIDAFVATLDDSSAYEVYIRSIKNSLNAEEEVEDWSQAGLIL